MKWKNDPTSTIVLLRRFDITAANHPEQGVYLRRWYIFRCPLGGVMLHKIMRPDTDRDLHDHPWAFISIVLRGGYDEEFLSDGPPLDGVREWHGLREVNRINHRPHGTTHRIDRLHRTPTWTLVLCGPKRSTWGFMVDGKKVPWREYIAARTPAGTP